MKTQIDIRKSKKWVTLFFALLAFSFANFAQPAADKGLDPKIISAVEYSRDNLNMLAKDTEKSLRYEAPAILDENQEIDLSELPGNSNSDVTVLLVEDSQLRHTELKSSLRNNEGVMQVGYFQKANNTTWYKIRKLFTNKPAVNCNACVKVVATPYTVVWKPRMK